MLLHFFSNVWSVSLLQLAREVLDIAAGMIKPGVTTEEIDHAVHLVRILPLCFEKFFCTVSCLRLINKVNLSSEYLHLAKN